LCCLSELPYQLWPCTAIRSDIAEQLKKCAYRIPTMLPEPARPWSREVNPAFLSGTRHPVPGARYPVPLPVTRSRCRIRGMSRLIPSLSVCLLALGIAVSATQPTAPRQLRIIAFGAHPDDAELKAAGVASLWAAQGHKVKFVAATNGDIGHFSQAGGPLAIRRYKEVQECARIMGITTDVLDIHDGELEPNLEYRRKFARKIREWQADIVMGHRPYDYHPDHRYVGVLLNDTAVVVGAAFFVPDTPPTQGNPIYLNYSDNFTDPKPFEPSVVVDIDASAEKKWGCISAMPSQFGDADSWQGRTRPDVPKDDAKRPAYLLELAKQRSAAVADQYRAQLIARYGQERGAKVKYAEAFQLNQYGRQVKADALSEMFPK
jgi:LmbE family N-acetylglucosaminyl deacetylase